MTDDHVELPPEAMSNWMLQGAPTSAGRAAKHRLVDAVRALIEAASSVRADDAAALDAEAAAISAATTRLRALPRFAAGATEEGGDDSRLLERSGISGASNPLATPLRIAVAPGGETVLGWATYGWPYEGPPGCVHGGFVAAAFDDLLGTAQTLSGIAGFTGTLSVRMVRPTPLHKRIDYEAGVRGQEGRKILTWATATCEGEVVATAEGIFVVPRGGYSDDRLARLRAPSLEEGGQPS